MNRLINGQASYTDPVQVVKVISEMLITLGQSLPKIDQMFIWRNYYQYPSKASLYKEQVYEWNKDIVTSDCSNIVHKLEEVVLPPELETEMLADRIVHGLVKNMTDPYSKALLEENSVKSSLMVAIFVGGELWGCLSLDNCTTEEEWNEEEIVLAKECSTRLGKYIEQSKSYGINCATAWP